MKWNIPCVVFTALLAMTSIPAVAATAADSVNTPAAPEAGPGAGGSALPPGTNPSTPSGGNGGDAAGYDHMPKPGEGAGKTTDAQGREKHNDVKGTAQEPKPSGSGAQ